jgi:uncharacterized protein YfkK (UPF0435 family)
MLPFVCNSGQPNISFKLTDVPGGSSSSWFEIGCDGSLTVDMDYGLTGGKSSVAASNFSGAPQDGGSAYYALNLSVNNDGIPMSLRISEYSEPQIQTAWYGAVELVVNYFDKTEMTWSKSAEAFVADFTASGSGAILNLENARNESFYFGITDDDHVLPVEMSDISVDDKGECLYLKGLTRGNSYRVTIKPTSDSRVSVSVIDVNDVVDETPEVEPEQPEETEPVIPDETDPEQPEATEPEQIEFVKLAQLEVVNYSVSEYSHYFDITYSDGSYICDFVAGRATQALLFVGEDDTEYALKLSDDDRDVPLSLTDIAIGREGGDYNLLYLKGLTADKIYRVTLTPTAKDVANLTIVAKDDNTTPEVEPEQPEETEPVIPDETDPEQPETTEPEQIEFVKMTQLEVVNYSVSEYTHYFDITYSDGSYICDFVAGRATQALLFVGEDDTEYALKLSDDDRDVPLSLTDIAIGREGGDYNLLYLKGLTADKIYRVTLTPTAKDVANLTIVAKDDNTTPEVEPEQPEETEPVIPDETDPEQPETTEPEQAEFVKLAQLEVINYSESEYTHYFDITYSDGSYICDFVAGRATQALLFVGEDDTEYALKLSDDDRDVPLSLTDIAIGREGGDYNLLYLKGLTAGHTYRVILTPTSTDMADLSIEDLDKDCAAVDMMVDSVSERVLYTITGVKVADTDNVKPGVYIEVINGKAPRKIYKQNK